MITYTDNTITSLFDAQYDLSVLRADIKESQESSDAIISKLADALYAKTLGEEVKDFVKPKVRYVVEDSAKLYKAIKNRAIKLDCSSDKQKMYAQIRNGNKFGKKLCIEEEWEFKDIDFAQLSNALQMKAIENQLESILDVLEEIETDVTRIIEGQQNDRIGFFFSGMNLYLESKSIQDEMLKKFVAANALKSLSDANAQMVQSIQTDIAYLLKQEYNKSKSKRLERINERMTSINKSFEVIYRSFILKAIIYYEQSEIQAMISAIDEYGTFLKNTIIPYAPQLSEHDINDIYLKDGIWERRAASILETEKIKAELQSPKVFYIEMESTKNEG